MIIRKLVSAIVSCVLVMIIYFIIEQSGFVILLGMYLLPILLFYGIPASILSDFATKKLRGVICGVLALLIHLILATLFILIPILFSEWERNILLSDIESLLENFFLYTAILSSCLFWCIDEFLKSKRVKEIRKKIDALKIY